MIELSLLGIAFVLAGVVTALGSIRRQMKCTHDLLSFYLGEFNIRDEYRYRDGK